MENCTFPYNAIVKNKTLNNPSKPLNAPKLNKKAFKSGLSLSDGDNKTKCIIC